VIAFIVSVLAVTSTALLSSSSRIAPVVAVRTTSPPSVTIAEAKVKSECTAILTVPLPLVIPSVPETLLRPASPVRSATVRSPVLSIRISPRLFRAEMLSTCVVNPPFAGADVAVFVMPVLALSIKFVASIVAVSTCVIDPVPAVRKIL